MEQKWKLNFSNKTRNLSVDESQLIQKPCSIVLGGDPNFQCRMPTVQTAIHNTA
jgi:hypothetical protein